MTIEIKKGIPYPTKSILEKYPLATMEVGDCFALPQDVKKTHVSNLTASANKKWPDRKYRQGVHEGRTHVWRLK